MWVNVKNVEFDDRVAIATIERADLINAGIREWDGLVRIVNTQFSEPIVRSILSRIGYENVEQWCLLRCWFNAVLGRVGTIMEVTDHPYRLVRYGKRWQFWIRPVREYSRKNGNSEPA